MIYEDAETRLGYWCYMHIGNSLAPRSKARRWSQVVCCPNNLGLRLTLGVTKASRADWLRGGCTQFMGVVCA